MNIYLKVYILFYAIICFSQEQIVYKKIDTTNLILKIYKPDAIKFDGKRPAMLFFFGGGWKTGNINQFEPQANYFAKRGIVCFLVEYRIQNKHQSTIYQSLQDAKSSIRFIRQQAKIFNIDPSKIIAAGGSAGGHLAAACALIDDFNEITDDLNISCKPNALVLLNPAIDNGPAGVGYERVKNNYKDISPIHNVLWGAPPTIILHGTKDALIPVETIKYFQLVMHKVGAHCQLVLYEGKEHGFFNYSKFENYKATIIEIDMFLQSLNMLSKNNNLEID